jgi:hypothetical protein
MASARHALGLTLYTMGRFDEARAVLAETTDPSIPELGVLARCLCIQGDRRGGLALLNAARARAPQDPALPREYAYLYFLLDDAAKALAWSERCGRMAPEQIHWVRLIDYWAGSRLGRRIDNRHESRIHGVLSALEAEAPGRAAEAWALYGEARFHQGPVWSIGWLDLALDQCERYGQHHLKTRLLVRKARALAAAGKLGEASRFGKLAQEWFQRQGAWLYWAGTDQ